MDGRPSKHRATPLGSRIWRPPRTVDLVLGLGLAFVLPWFASQLTTGLAVFEQFPALPFLAATLATTLVGRLSAGLVATVSSALLIAYYHLLPAGGLDGVVEDLFALVLVVGISFAVAYAMALKDGTSERAAARRSEAELLAGQLAAERNTMRQILQQMPNGVMVADADGKLTLANPRAREMLELRDPTEQPPDELGEGASWSARHADGKPYDSRELPLVRSVTTGEIVIAETMLIEHGDGSTVTVECDSAPIRSSIGDTVLGAVMVFQDVTDRVETQARLALTSRRLAQIQTVTDAALTDLGFDDLADRLLWKVREVLETDSATLLLLDRSGTVLVEHQTIGADIGDRSKTIPVGTGVAGKIASSVAPLVAEDLSSYEVARPWLTRMRSLMGVPLVYRGQVRGVIHVATRSRRHFTTDDIEVAELAAKRIASALERAALRDSRSAMVEALQRSLLPASLPQIEGVEIGTVYRPYSPNDEIGGDFFGFYPHGEGSWGVVVGDVSGKGPDAAAVMGLAAHTVPALARYESQPSAVLAALNETFLRAERVATERFCTACEIRLRTDSDHLRVTICLAGHLQPFVMRADGRVEHAGIPGTLLGTFTDPELHDDTVDLSKGDALVAYTDGLVERRGVGIEQGERALAELLTTCTELTGAEIADRIERELVDGVMLDDDVAVVVIRKR